MYSYNNSSMLSRKVNLLLHLYTKLYRCWYYSLYVVGRYIQIIRNNNIIYYIYPSKIR